jgi:phage terminase large subunit
VGHQWYRGLIIVPWLEKRETTTRHVQVTVDDNQFVDAEYKATLQSYTGWMRKAYLDGDWDIAAGQYFTNFRREVHALSDFDDTRAVEWFAALDYGFAHYTVVLLGCRDGDGNIFIVDEHAERLWLPQRNAAAVKAMLARHKIGERKISVEDLKRFVTGADVFSRQSDGTTIAAQYAKLGISLRCANTDRVNGWAEILQRFGDVEGGVKPTLFIHKRCGRLLETLPALQHDPNRPEDVLKVDCDEDGIGGDDAADVLRYLVATKSRAVTQRKLRGL